MNIAITGLGILCAIGNDSRQVLEALQQGRSGIGTMRYLPSSHKELPVGEVKMSDEELKRALGVDPAAIISRTTLLGAAAVRQAVCDAGLSDPGSLDGKRTVLLSGTTVGGMDVTERLFGAMKHDDTLLGHIKSHDCGSCTRDIARMAGLQCETGTISTACSSALNSIITGCEMLRNGEADVVIAGGAEALSRFHLNGFNTLMILDKRQCRPFDKERAGLNLGEGAAYVVLQRDVNDTAKAKAYIGGYGNRCDACHQTASSADGEGAYLAMAEALRSADMTTADIDYVNAHGTGTPNNDSSESAAMRRLFGSGEMPPVSSTKGMTGHATSAAGSIETVISILAMRHGFIPPNKGWQTPDEDCIVPDMGAAGQRTDNVLCNAFGFGGNDSALLLCRRPHDVEPMPERRYEAEVLADVTVDNAEQLKDCRDFIPPMESRRMDTLTKAATLAAMKAMRQSGTDCPDAIISATAYGMMATSEKFLDDLCANGEELLKPTLFMQSTHNTIGSAIAIRTRCHGYNITYTHGDDSMQWALRDARRLIACGKAATVLVEYHDESTPLFRDMCRRLGVTPPKELFARNMVLGRKDHGSGTERPTRRPTDAMHIQTNHQHP